MAIIDKYEYQYLFENKSDSEVDILADLLLEAVLADNYYQKFWDHFIEKTSNHGELLEKRVIDCLQSYANSGN